jgi:hypothetical protein
MEDKYYTPSIEEFHIGFLHEYKLGENWLSTTFDGKFYRNDWGFPYIPSAIWRVKYLDQSDIESCGFTEDKKVSNNYRGNFEMYGKSFGTYGISIIWETRDVTIYRYDETKEYALFEGIIKNISELKVLLKQIRIE